jgi:hypothetical protein
MAFLMCLKETSSLLPASTDFSGYQFHYMCADDELNSHLFLFIHITARLSTVLISLLF